MPVFEPQNAIKIDSDLAARQTLLARSAEAVAATFGGTRTAYFEQSHELFALRRCYRGTDTWKGSCRALSMYWIACHANDQDFWAFLDRRNTIGSMFAHAVRVHAAQAEYAEHHF